MCLLFDMPLLCKWHSILLTGLGSKKLASNLSNGFFKYLYKKDTYLDYLDTKSFEAINLIFQMAIIFVSKSIFCYATVSDCL